jgi:hypothetical protein
MQDTYITIRFVSGSRFILVQNERSMLGFQLSDNPSHPYSGADVYNVMRDLVTSGCGYIDFHETVRKFGIEKVSKMIENRILFLRPSSKPLGRVAMPEDNVLMATGAPALRAMELIQQDPKYNYLKEQCK